MVVNSLRRDQLVRGASVGRMDDDGNGVVTVYVRRDKQAFEFPYPRTLPGETLHLRVQQAKHDRFKGKKQAGKYRLYLEERGAPSPEEVAPACEHFNKDKCGGCAIQHLAYAAQLEEKDHWLSMFFHQYGLRAADVRKIVPSPAKYGFHC